MSEQFGTSVLKPESLEGFVQAYEVLTSAIAEEDDSFVREVCEPVFADHLLSAMSDLKKKGLRLVKVVPESGRRAFSLNFNGMSVHAFQPFDRRLRQKTMNLKTPALDLNVGIQVIGDSTFRHMAVLALTVEIDTNVFLKLVARSDSSKTEVVSTAETLQSHRVEFAIPKTDFMKDFDFKSLLGVQMAAASPGETLGKLFASEKYEWFIHDIDDFMKSKELIASN